MPPLLQDNAHNRPRAKNPMNLTIDTSGEIPAIANNPKTNDLQLPQQNRFPLDSPILVEIPSPENSSGSEKGPKAQPKLVNAGLSGSTDSKGESLNLHADSALSRTEFERAIRARLEQGDKAMQNMGSNTQQQRPAGLQLMTEFPRDDAQSEKASFLDLSDLKSIVNAREKERLGEYNSSSQSLQQPLHDRAEELSPSDRPIMIGLTVPYDQSTRTNTATAAGETIDSASSRTPATPSIVITPAREHPPWHMDMHMDMSTSPEMLHRPRAASSIYSQPSPKLMYDEDAPPVPAIPAFHSATSFEHHHPRPISTGTEFEGEEQVSSTDKDVSPTTSRKNMKKKLLHKLSVNTSDANRPQSQGWWTYLLSPLLSRSNTVSSRRTVLSPQQPQTRSARSPLSAVSFSKALSPRQPTTASDEGGSTHWWDDEKIVVPPAGAEKSHFSPDTPEDMTRHIPPIMAGMTFHDEQVTSTRALPGDEKADKTRSIFRIGDEMVPNYEFHGARAEYYQASAHDLYDKENPYFECVNHVCSMTSAKRRAEVEAAEREAEQKMAEEAENGRGGLAVFVFDPSRDANNPFIAFLEKRSDVKEVVVDGEDEQKDEQNGEKGEGEGGEEVEKTGLSNARELLSFDSSDEDEDAPADAEKGHTASRGLSPSPDLAPTSRSVASFSPPPRSRYEPSVSLPPVEERGIATPPPAPPSVSYSRELSPPPAPAPAPLSAPAPSYAPPYAIPAPAPAPPPAPAVAAPPPVQMPMMPPPQPRAFSPEPVPMPMPPPPQPRAFSPEPVAMPMPPAPVPAPAPPPPREPVPMPMPVPQSAPVEERAPAAMPPPQPPLDDATRGIPGGYQWEPAPVAREMSPPRMTGVASPPIPPAAPVPVPQSWDVEESASRPGPISERDAEPVLISRPAPSFSRPTPFLAPRRVPQPPPPAEPQQSASDAPADESDAESVLPPYSRNAPRQPGLPTYSARDQSEYHDRAPVAPGQVSPGLQQTMTSRGGIPMSDVSQRSRDMDFSDTASVSRPGEPRTIINVHHYYNGEYPRDAPEPPGPAGNQFVSEADLQQRNENETRRQRLEKEDNLAKKVGGFWRGRGCIPKKGCFGRRGGREERTRRRWYAAIIAFCIVVIVLSISLATTLTRKGDRMSVESQWLNISGFPPIPTGIMTVAGPAPAVERSSCVAPTSIWSCALPPEQQASNAGGYAADAPNFRIEIRFRNDSSLLSNSTANSTTTKRSWGGIFRRDDWTASPAAPRLVDQIFLGNTTDNVTTPFQGEDTPFYITFLSPVDVANTSAEYVKRQVSSTVSSTSTGTGTAIATGTGTGTGTSTTHSATGTATGTQTQTSTSTTTSSSTPEVNVGNLIPAPDLASDGTAAAATLYPLPVQQPIKLYNRGLPTEHYGFFTYFDKSIFLASDAPITGGSTDTDSRDANGGSTETEASVRCTWSQTRFLVQIWTQPQNVTNMSLSALSNTTATNSSSTTTSASAATASSTSSSITTSSANNFTSPGSFPYPITITVDRHGGIATEKLAYCYGIEHQNSSSSSSSAAAGTYYNLTDPKLQAEQRDSGGSIVSPSPDYFVLAAALASGATPDQESPVDGGTGGCMCEWRNWIETK